MKSKLLIIAAILLVSCNRHTPQVIYTENTIKKTDTVTVKSVDTIPCDDFEAGIFGENTDTVYVKVIDKQIQVKYIRTRDTVYLTPTIVHPQPRKQVTKIDNSNTAKKGGIIGDGNTQDNRRQLAWWWILLAGGLSMFILQNVVWRTVKIYFPILNVIK